MTIFSSVITNLRVHEDSSLGKRNSVSSPPLYVARPSLLKVTRMAGPCCSPLVTTRKAPTSPLKQLQHQKRHARPMLNIWCMISFCDHFSRLLFTHPAPAINIFFQKN